MAIGDKDEQNTVNGTTRTAPPQFNGANTPPTGTPAPTQWNLASPSPFGAPIGRTLGSEYLTALAAALVETYKTATSDVELTLITMDNSVYPIRYSCLVLCMCAKNRPDTVAYYTLIVEATGDKLTPVFEQINGRQIEIVRTTTMAMDEVLARCVHDVVKKEYPNKRLLNSEALVVPRGFNVTNKVKMHQLALEASWNCSTVLSMDSPNFADVNLATAKSGNGLTVTLAVNNTQIENAVGEPVRADISVSLSDDGANNNNRNMSINSGSRQTDISRLDGFIDMVWSPTRGSVYDPYTQIQQTQGQLYAARFVITNVETSLACTPANVLLAIATSSAISANNNWIQAFRPIMGSDKGVDLRDIGALGFEANFDKNPNGVGSRVNTKTAEFGLHQLGHMITAIIQPGISISMDVPDCGPSTSKLSMFAAASNGNTDATTAIYNAANELTNGHFGKLFPVGRPMFVDQGNRVYMGHYLNNEGVATDMRAIDYLAVANVVGDVNPGTIRAYSDTVTRTEYPVIQRLFERKKIVQGVAGDTLEITGMADRVTFSGEMLSALVQGCNQAGLAVKLNTPMTGSDFHNERGVGSFVASSMMLPTTTMAINTAGNGFNGVYQPQTQNRW